MSTKPIAEWAPGDSVSAYVYLTAPELLGTSRGRRYTATASDATASISVVDFKGVLTAIEGNKFYAIRGTVSEYNGNLQILPSDCRCVTEEDRACSFDESKCVLSAPEPIEKLVDELKGYHDSLSSADARSCWAVALDTFLPDLSVWPAAKSVHHAYRGGLIFHTTSMLRAGKLLASCYGLDWDVLALGILFHDLGKIKEIGPRPGDDYTGRGLAEGHIHTSAFMWRRIWKYVDLHPQSPLCTHVTHLILSHHGSKELGSPVTPLTREAWALHYLDMIDSRLEIVRDKTKGVTPGTVVDCWPLGKAVKWPRVEEEDNRGGENELTDTGIGSGDGPI